MQAIIEDMYSWFSFMPRMTFKNLIEIAIISYLIYEMLVWIKNTRAWTLLKGILLILGFVAFATFLQLDTILWLMERISLIGMTALVIIFQPELRKALEQLGSQNVLARLFQPEMDKNKEEFSRRTIDELVRACVEMSKVKTGALIVLERHMSLGETVRTGIEVDGLITSQLLINIFEHNTPLHDGAVVVEGNRVVAATCYLPLSENMDISKNLGTRHRAAVGISEVTDSVTLVVSEETGNMSVAIGGGLQVMKDGKELTHLLEQQMIQRREVEKTGLLNRITRRIKHETKADE